MLKRKRNEQRKGAPMWMSTFSDLMTLILVFFILLYSFSEIDANKFRMIANSFKGTIDGNSSPIPMEYPPLEKPLEVPSSNPVYKPEVIEEMEKIEERNRQLDELLKKIKSYLKENNLEGVIVATREERGIELVLQENILFDSARAIIKNEAKPFLNEVADLITTIPNFIEVEGHTDSQPIIQPSRYKSNWNLSGDRAANVVNYFIDEHSISSERFRFAGYADIKPAAPNISETGRVKNRRVVIVILDEKIDEELVINNKDSQYIENYSDSNNEESSN